MSEAPVTDGFAFIEFVDTNPQLLCRLLTRMGFKQNCREDNTNVRVLRQGQITFVVNTQGSSFCNAHGPSVRGIGLRVFDPEACAQRTLSAGALPLSPNDDGAPVVEVPTVHGIGDSLLYFVPASLPDPLQTYDRVDDAPHIDCGLTALDHTSHIVRPENLDRWAAFYSEALGFSQRQYLDVRGTSTGMRARSMVGGCGKARIPIAASAHDDAGTLNQNDEFIRDYHGEGVQHIALATENIFRSVDALRAVGIEFMDPPADSYYEGLDRRIPGHGQSLDELRGRGIMLDGTSGGDTLLQIFTRRQIGPVFFEIIQRNNHQGFGEGNFRALFESQELDQLRRHGQKPG